MNTVNIENKSFILSKEELVKVKSIWKDLSKNKKATLSHHVFYFLLTAHEPELVFEKAFSPLVNKNKINNVNGEIYATVKQELLNLNFKNISVNYIEPWLPVLLKEDEYTIKGTWGKSIESNAEILDIIRKKAQVVLKHFNEKVGV